MTQQDTIQFFEKAGLQGRAQPFRGTLPGDKDAAENLKAKIIHYRRAIEALEQQEGSR